MARTLTPIDIHLLLNEIVNEALGTSSSVYEEAIDLSDIVSVGETLLASGVENTLNAISLVLGRTIVAVRPYDAKLRLISEDYAGEYANRIRKISFLMEPALPAGNWNTQIATNLADGFTNGQNPDPDNADAPRSTKSMWEQHVRIPIELNFGGASVWQTAITTYKYQLKVAFRSEADFSQFISGILTTVANEIEIQKEAFNRMALLNFIGGKIALGQVINLVDVANDMFGLSLGVDDYLTTNRKELLTAFVTQVKKVSRNMTYMNGSYVVQPTRADGKMILRHTPREMQRLIMLDDFIIDAEAMVLPEIFNDNYLRPEQGERVAFWQYNVDGERDLVANLTVAIPSDDGNGGFEQGSDTADEARVMALMFDRDAIMTNWMIDDTLTTPVEARKAYWNTWYSFARNAINDFTEQGVVFILADPTEGDGGDEDGDGK